MASTFLSLNRFFIVSICSVLTACGEKDEDKKSSQGTLSDESIENARYQSAASLQDVSEAVASSEAASAGVMLSAFNSASSKSPTRTCETGEDGSVKVTETRDWSDEKTVEGGRWNRTWTVTRATTRIQTWTTPEGGDAISCNEGNRAQINWTDSSSVNGLALDVEIDGNRSATIALSGDLPNGESVNLDLGWTRTAKGSRNIVHSEHAASATEISFVRTISSSVLRTDSGTRRKKGTPKETESYNFEHTVSTKEGAPLKVKTDVAVETRDWSKKTILEGILVSTRNDVSRVESSFSNLVFENGKCAPVSGEVNVSVYPFDAAADASPTDTFVLNFGADTESGVAIEAAGADEADFPEGLEFLANCDFGT